VLNLSFGTDSVQDSRLDPLSYAVEVAWRKGIVVVAAVGNDGATRTRVSMPAANPYIIAVGAADPMSTEDRSDDKVAPFSTLGNATRHADILAPGRSVVSLRDPGSYIDAQYPAALVRDPQQRFFRGSGTSQAAAVVSGIAALLLQQRPTLTPDQVKRLLMTSRQAMSSNAGDVYAAGQLDMKKAIDTATPTFAQTYSPATGQGSPAVRPFCGATSDRGCLPVTSMMGPSCQHHSGAGGLGLMLQWTGFVGRNVMPVVTAMGPGVVSRL
jgi:serine protease AprX